MSPTTMKKAISMNRPLLSLLTLGASVMLSAAVQAAAPGITGPTFNLNATNGNLNQPAGNAVYAGAVWRPRASSPPPSPTQAADSCRYPVRR